MRLKVFAVLALMACVANASPDADMEEAIKRSLKEQEEQEQLKRVLKESLEISRESSGAAAARPPHSPRPESPSKEIHEWENRPFSTKSATMVDIGYDASGRTEQYKFYSFPKAPMAHTYNPYKGAADGEDHMWQREHHVPHISVNLKAPTKLFREHLPKNVQDAIKDIPSEKLDIFWIVQDNPWTASARVLFRPHYWADPTAPVNGQYSKKIAVHAKILSSIPDGISLSENNFGITIHQDAQGYIISSPDNAHIPGAARPNETFSFWSLTQANGRTAITLHWFLNDKDNDLMLEAIRRSGSLKELLEVFNRISSHRGSPILQSRLLPELNEFLEFHPRR